MSNLVKYHNIVSDSEAKVIDYNALISEKILKIQETIETNVKTKETVDFVNGINVNTALELLDDNDRAETIMDVDSAKEQAGEIIARANEDADSIIERAKEESDIIRSDNAEIGRKEGYEEGKRQAEEELAALKQSIEDEKLQMEIEYNQRLNEMEPMLVETILQVFEKVTHVLSVDKKDLVLHLVNDVLSKTEISKEFLIRVSSEDYRFMLDNRERISGVVSKKVQIEIVEEPAFKRGQCMIESDSGIYDCSLDIQLENLIEAIKLMSCLVAD